MAYFVVVLGALLVIGGVVFEAYVLRPLIKDPLSGSASEKQYLAVGVSWLLIACGFCLFGVSILLFNPAWSSISAYPQGSLFEGEAIIYGLQVFLIVFGGFLFGASLASLSGSWALKFLKVRKIDPSFKKIINIVFYVSIPVLIVAFLLATSGYGPYLSYPLWSGIQIDGSGIHMVTAADRGGDGLHIAFYAICILTGVFICYFVCDHYFYKRYGKHGILDTLVLVAFPAGVIGARIWYVVGNFEREFANGDWTDVFKIWDGGLTILGGAAFGIIVGYLFMRWRKKYVDPRWALDIIVPTILLAQAMGRWGNFFNCEVYGQVTSVDGWRFLPNWLLLQMNVNNDGSLLGPGLINTPLFLIEGFVNVVGFFLIYVGIGRFLKRWTVPGDLAGAYFTWYGLVRLIMEPLRNANFNMGMDNSWSISNSIAYILIGLALILALHLHDYYVKNKKNYPFALCSVICLFIGLFLPFAQSLTVADGVGDVVATYSGFALMFELGAPIFLASYILTIIALLIFICSFLLALFPLKQCPRIHEYFLYAGGIVSLVAAIMVFFGDKALSLPPELGNNGLAITLSYGFVLLALVAGVSTVLALARFIAGCPKKPLPPSPFLKNKIDENISHEKS